MKTPDIRLVQPGETAEKPEPTEIPVHSARALTGDSQTASIVYGDQVYTLRITRNGKLILTK